jgi:hypothetical protein
MISAKRLGAPPRIASLLAMLGAWGVSMSDCAKALVATSTDRRVAVHAKSGRKASGFIPPLVTW